MLARRLFAGILELAILPSVLRVFVLSSIGLHTNMKAYRRCSGISSISEVRGSLFCDAARIL